jgi:hypothetical protein
MQRIEYAVPGFNDDSSVPADSAEYSALYTSRLRQHSRRLLRLQRVSRRATTAQHVATAAVAVLQPHWAVLQLDGAQRSKRLTSKVGTKVRRCTRTHKRARARTATRTRTRTYIHVRICTRTQRICTRTQPPSPEHTDGVHVRDACAGKLRRLQHTQRVRSCACVLVHACVRLRARAHMRACVRARIAHARTCVRACVFVGGCSRANMRTRCSGVPEQARLSAAQAESTRRRAPTAPPANAPPASSPTWVLVNTRRAPSASPLQSPPASSPTWVLVSTR